MSRSPASGCAGAAMTTCGCAAKAWATVSRPAGGRAAHHAQVELVAREHLHQPVAVADGQVHAHLGVAAAVQRQPPRQHVLPGADDAQRDRAALGAGEQPDARLAAADLGEHRRGQPLDLGAGLGQVQLARDVVEQRQADQLLELLDLHPHRRLRQVKLLRGAGEVPVLRRGEEDLQLAQRDVADAVVAGGAHRQPPGRLTARCLPPACAAGARCPRPAP